MTNPILDRATWLRDTRTRLGWSAKEVADQAHRVAQLRGLPLSLTQQAVSHFETGKSKSIPRWIELVEEAVDLAAMSPTARADRELFIETYPNGIIDASVDEQEYHILKEIGDYSTEQKAALLHALQTGGLSASPVSTDLTPFDLVAISRVDLAYGMGGTYADLPIEVQVEHFPRAWVESITRTPANDLTFALGRGESMEPTLRDGDMVLIDRSQRTVREQDAIWALTWGEIAMIKRVRVRGPQVLLLSDNDRVPSDEVHHDEINIVGRVVFIGRRM